MSFACFPQSLEPVYIGGGVWMRVKVLDLTDALTSIEGLEAAVSIAQRAAEPEDAVVREGPGRGLRLRDQVRTMKVLQGVARQAVVGFCYAAHVADAEQEMRREAAAAARAAMQVQKGDDTGEAVVAAEAAAQAVRDSFSPGEPPEAWDRINLVANQTDEDRNAGKVAIASVDQIAPGWVYRVGDVALRAGLDAARSVSPLSETGT